MTARRTGTETMEERCAPVRIHQPLNSSHCREIMVAAIVLAAGASSRMGSRNKLLLPYHGKPILTHVVECTLASSVGEVVVVVGHEAELVQDVLTGYAVSIAHNTHYHSGKTSSIRVGMAAASAMATGYMICLADLPLVTSAEYNWVIDAFLTAHAEDPLAIVRPIYEGQPGHPVILSATYRQELLSTDTPHACRNVVRRHHAFVREILWNTDHVIRDVDTPEAYAALLDT